VSTTCDGYFDIDNCIQDPICVWCYNRWDDLGGICISDKASTDSCLEVIDYEGQSKYQPIPQYQLMGKLAGVGVVMFVMVALIIGSIYFCWQFFKSRKRVDIPKKERRQESRLGAIWVDFQHFYYI